MSTRPAKKRPSRSTLRARADREFSLYIRGRDKACYDCGEPNLLQCAHIISRRYHAIRWDPDNALALCRGCHMFYTHHPLEWEAVVEGWFPGRLASLRKLALAAHPKPDYDVILAGLKELRG